MRSVFCAVVLGCLASAGGQVVRIDEAETAKVTCAAGMEMGGSIWASGGKIVPPFWGRAAGDSVEWVIPVTAAKDLHLSVRYSYFGPHYRGFSGTEAAERTLHLTIDGGPEVIKVPVPNTGGWEIFDTAVVPLPPLKAGRHTVRLVSPVEHCVANVDCVVLSHGGKEKLPAPQRATTLAHSPSMHFAIRVTPTIRLRTTPDQIFKEFERIYDHYKDYMGWEPPTPVAINLIEDRLWPNPGATAFQNAWGVFFRAGAMDREQGNWCHEMTHMFYVAHFPNWFDESSVHTLTVFNWVPALYSKGRRPEHNPYYQQCVNVAKQVLNGNGPVEDITQVQYAVRVKYGPDVFKRFFHACMEAGKTGELDFTPGRWMTKQEIVKYMSVAAGEDVGPLYARWTGFAGAQ